MGSNFECQRKGTYLEWSNVPITLNGLVLSLRDAISVFVFHAMLRTTFAFQDILC
jgi:hypothetical protein